MINYALAKELKEAGFPQEGKQGHHIHDWVHDPAGGIHYYEPTLSELIEACGDRELALEKGESAITHGYEWRARIPFQEPVGFGSTPEEAVARLWLALNKPE